MVAQQVRGSQSSSRKQMFRQNCVAKVKVAKLRSVERPSVTWLARDMIVLDLIRSSPSHVPPQQLNPVS